MKKSSFPPVKLGRAPKSMVDFLLFCPSYRLPAIGKWLPKSDPRLILVKFWIARTGKQIYRYLYINPHGFAHANIDMRSIYSVGIKENCPPFPARKSSKGNKRKDLFGYPSRDRLPYRNSGLISSTSGQQLRGVRYSPFLF